jgi:hypothetical protein
MSQGLERVHVVLPAAAGAVVISFIFFAAFERAIFAESSAVEHASGALLGLRAVVGRSPAMVSNGVTGFDVHEDATV